MKNQKLTLSTIFLFIIVNTSYYWESKISFLIIPLTFLLAIIFFVLTVLTIREVYLSTRERFNNKQRLFSALCSTIILILIFFKPFGVFNFEKLEGEDLLVAQSEGAANCLLTLKLKDNNKFIEKSVCFGVNKINGNYKIQQDTIFFENTNDSYAEFAILKSSKSNSQKLYLIKYESSKDTSGYELQIIKNKIDLKPNR